MPINDELRRLIISDSDLYQAKQFIEYIIEKKLHNDESDEAKLILLAFNTAVIVSYSRPFKKSRNSETEPTIKMLPESFKTLLTENELILHNRVIQMRDTEYAHSDANSHSVRFYGEFAISRNPFIPLNQSEFIKLNEIINKLLLEIHLDKNS